MQLTSFLLPVLSLAAAVQAAPAPQAGPGETTRQPTFSITNFYNAGSPHSAQVSISFDVKSNPKGLNGGVIAKCFATHPIGSGTAGTKDPITTTKYFTKCKPDKTGFGFTWEPSTNTYLFSVTQNTGGNVLSGSISIPKKIKVQKNTANPNGNFNYLDFPKSFTIHANLPGVSA